MTNRMWAPWRLQYVTKASNKKNKTKKERCVFCSKCGSRKDRTHFVLERSSLSFALLNIYPYNNGHLMIAPKRHVADLDDLDDAELLDLMKLVKKMKRLLAKKIKPHGFNIGINCGLVAGAGIRDHLHVHIVPRWNGDTNFMPVLADTKVIPQSLTALYNTLVGKK